MTNSEKRRLRINAEAESGRYEKRSEPRLIERPEVTKTLYHIQPDEKVAFKVGDIVRAMLPANDGPVIAASGHKRMGVIEGDGGIGLKQALAELNGPGIADLRITGIEEITNEAIAEMVVQQRS